MSSINDSTLSGTELGDLLISLRFTKSELVNAEVKLVKARDWIDSAIKVVERIKNEPTDKAGG